MIGLAFRETMSGGYHLLSEPGRDRPMSFTVSAQINSLASMITNPVLVITGAVAAEGLADYKPLAGTLCIDPVKAKVLVYSFLFDDNDGNQCSFFGRKTLSQGNIVHAMTVLPAGIYDGSGKAIGEALLRFDLRNDLWKFLRSFHTVGHWFS